MARWSLRLSELELVMIHCAGITYQATGDLSRIKTTKYDTFEMEDDLPTYVDEIMVESMEYGKMDCEDSFTECIQVELHGEERYVGLPDVLKHAEEKRPTPPIRGELLNTEATDG